MLGMLILVILFSSSLFFFRKRENIRQDTEFVYNTAYLSRRVLCEYYTVAKSGNDNSTTPFRTEDFFQKYSGTKVSAAGRPWNVFLKTEKERALLTLTREADGRQMQYMFRTIEELVNTESAP